MEFVDRERTLRVRVGEDVLDTFSRNQQLHWWQPERGGVLFAKSVGHTDGRVEIIDATEPHSRDKSGRTWLKLDHRRCIAEIEQRYEAGLHFVGYWHTHPQLRPKFSAQDVASFTPLFTDPGVDLDRLIMIVVGGNRETVALDVAVLDRRRGLVSPLCPSE